MPLSAQDVAEIARLLEESDFEELHVEQDGLKLTLRRGGVPPRLQAAAPALGTAPTPAAPRSEPPAVPAVATGADAVSVIAPLVGIFYRAPRPGAPPFVDVGSAVEADTIVGIIEVMKLMNTVRAEAVGTVSAILVEDGGVVEYGQPLMRITRGSGHG